LNAIVDDITIIRSGTTLRDPEAWTFQYKDVKHRDWEQFLRTYSLATVTLVKTEGLNILIDTAWEPLETKTNRLILELQYHGLAPDDIDEIFVTHWHGDHFLNIPLFPKARVFYAGCPPRIIKHRMADMNAENETIKLREGEDWHSGLSIIATPGHSNHDHSVVMNQKKRVFVAAGDSIVSKMYYHTETFFPNERMEKHLGELKDSFKRIINLADFIIPGHDGPFYNYKKGDE
jgi:glyoxylase-like metal-dependent hydrolase (beta-lactamase superfamily II)